MKVKFNLFILFFSLFVISSNRADAQFWKEWFHKEKPKHKPVQRKPLPHTQPVTKVKPKRKEIEYPATQFKNSYRIDVLAPLYLNELVKEGKPGYKDRIPDKAASGLEFYKGMSIAADTLNIMGYKLNLYIHDIADSQSTPEVLIHSKALDSSDLIIGVLQSQQIPAIAQFAKKKSINFISALSPADAGETDNPYFTLLQPSLQSHCEYIKSRVLKKYHNHKPILYYRTSVPVDDNAYHYFLKNEDGEDDESKFYKLPCNIAPDRKKLQTLFDSTVTNVIIMTVFDNAYAASLLKQISEWFPAYHFDIYGMPSWKAMSELRKNEAYPNIVAYVTEPFHFDPTTVLAQQIANAYKKEYDGRPGELTYRGFETLYWYAYLLHHYGTMFDSKMGDNAACPFTKFDIKAQWDSDQKLQYNENKHLYLFRYQSGSYMIE